MGRRRMSVRIAGRARRSGDRGTRNGGSARVVRRRMISMRSDPAPIRGGRSMTVGAILRPGMSVGPALAFSVSHGAPLGGNLWIAGALLPLRRFLQVSSRCSSAAALHVLLERLFRPIPLPRPRNDTVRRHVGKIADKFETRCLMGTVGAQIAARFGAFGRFRAICLGVPAEFRILVCLLQHGAPYFELGRDDWFMHPDRRWSPRIRRTGHVVTALR